MKAWLVPAIATALSWAFNLARGPRRWRHNPRVLACFVSGRATRPRPLSPGESVFLRKSIFHIGSAHWGRGASGWDGLGRRSEALPDTGVIRRQITVAENTIAKTCGFLPPRKKRRACDKPIGNQ